MIYYDTTKMGSARHRSGLMRLTSRLLEELGSSITQVRWDGRAGTFVTGKPAAPVPFGREDWLLTVEMFSEAERPGFTDFLRHPPCRLAAMFHDAIPVRWPHITWPQSVRRHPEYMKLLALFDRTWAISEATRRDFVDFWRWQGVTPKAEPGVVSLGADFDGGTRVQRDPVDSSAHPSLLCVGIVEPRKNQDFLLGVAEGLWRDGLDFELHVVGRVNPHFGAPAAKRMRMLEKAEPRFSFHPAATDRELAQLYAGAGAVVFPTIAEGCGLPLLEALWRGVPCVCSDLPVLRENADGGGCLVARVNDEADWREKLRTVLADTKTVRRLQAEAMARPLPRWSATAQFIRKELA
ncbi:MAG TPA: glycosyltransferase [Lacunisphaera sp.]|nr:glycosyltransferase [Lacunisphaera sp.]